MFVVSSSTDFPLKIITHEDDEAYNHSCLHLDSFS